MTLLTPVYYIAHCSNVLVVECAEAALQRCSYKKDVLKICSKFTGEHPCRTVISMK